MQFMGLHKSPMIVALRSVASGLAAATFLFHFHTLALAEVQRFRLKPEESRILTKIKDPFGNIITGSLRVREGEVSADPDRLKETGMVNLVLLATSYDSDLGLRDKTVREDYLEVQQYPTIRFSTVEVMKVERSAPVEKGWKMWVRGTLLLHGVRKEITVPVEVRDDGKKIAAQGRLQIHLEDFKMVVPSLLFLKAGNQVDVEFTIIGER